MRKLDARAGLGRETTKRRRVVPEAMTKLPRKLPAVMTLALALCVAGPSPAAAQGTKLIAGKSEFGTMLWGPNRQAIYYFQRDRRNRPRCYGSCAVDWPPVLTEGKPVAGRAVRRRLLGTVRRRDGTQQVTYAGKPLYYYAHEGPRQVLCHNVRLNGGLWWVLGPDGRRRP